MKSTRRLALRRESLTELTPAELAAANGAAGDPPSLNGPCDVDDFNRYAREWTLAYTLHKDCSWSCP